jgi:hypothetical protein
VRVEVRRSSFRMWLLAMAGIPLMVLGLDVVTSRRLTDMLRAKLFPPNETQIFEPRDEIWAWAMLAFGVFLVIWGLKELFVPTVVVEASPRALRIKLSGPGRPHTEIPWAHVVGITARTVDDEGQPLKLLAVEVDDPAVLPRNPWGARWIGDRTIGVLTQDWHGNPWAIAEELSRYAVTEAVRVEAALEEE